MDTNIREFFEKCQEIAPERQPIKPANVTVANGQYALVRVIGEDENLEYIQILAIGDLAGVTWLYEQASEYFVDFKGGIVEMNNYYLVQ